MRVQKNVKIYEYYFLMNLFYRKVFVALKIVDSERVLESYWDLNVSYFLKLEFSKIWASLN
jgi:hypothetical protein